MSEQRTKKEGAVAPYVMSKQTCLCGCGERVRNKGRFISGHKFENQGKGDQHVSLHADRKQPLPSEWRKTRKPYSGPPSWLGQENKQ